MECASILLGQRQSSNIKFLFNILRLIRSSKCDQEKRENQKRVDALRLSLGTVKRKLGNSVFVAEFYNKETLNTHQSTKLINYTLSIKMKCLERQSCNLKHFSCSNYNETFKSIVHGATRILLQTGFIR